MAGSSWHDGREVESIPKQPGSEKLVTAEVYNIGYADSSQIMEAFLFTTYDCVWYLYAFTTLGCMRVLVSFLVRLSSAFYQDQMVEPSYLVRSCGAYIATVSPGASINGDEMSRIYAITRP